MRLLIFGPPGAGKGTQAEFISKKFDIPHVSTGDIFRENIKNNTPLGAQAKCYSDAGDLVPDEVTTNMVRSRLNMPDCRNGFLLDGYPRTPAQADSLKEYLQKLNTQLDAVINMIVPDEEIITRLTGRGRIDDGDDTVKKRLGIYHDTTKPLAKYYAEINLLIDIEGVGAIDEITRRIIDGVNGKADGVNGKATRQP